MLGRAALCTLVLWGSAAHTAELVVRVDLSDQEMTVLLDHAPAHSWPVSTARAGKVTPTGLYSVQSMVPMHYSTLYDNAPMPWSIFFSGNYAIHGTTQTDRLGTPASAGCVRLHPDNARTLYDLVQSHGRDMTRIEIVD
jgi:lipoprotein-anchoring transpeptidase ErfK/SrfK